jgi:hypothetical protein
MTSTDLHFELHGDEQEVAVVRLTRGKKHSGPA